MPVSIKLPKSKTKNTISTKNNGLIQRITFFGDSAILEDDPIYKSVWQTARDLAEKGYSIVNGGGPGIMKASTDGAESVNGDTIAIYWEPKLASVFEGKNLANVTDESATFSNYMMRTLGLIEQGDAYIVCKGGTGTISELGMVWALSKLYYGCHKPVILFGDFWDDLIIAFQKAMNLDDIELEVLYQATNSEEILNILKKHELKIKHCKDKKVNGDEAGFIIGNKVKLTQEAHDISAQSYHEEHAGQLVAQSQLDEFISLINSPAKVLDIGTGPGQDVSYLSKKFAVTGIEISQKFAEIAKFENPDTEIINADIITYDIGKNIFKGVWARNSIHHIPKEYLQALFNKVFASLVEGGYFYIIARSGTGEFFEEENHNYLKVQKFFHLFSEEEISQLAKDSGFTVEKIEHTRRSHKWIIAVLKK